jgi:hypothetical protein
VEVELTALQEDLSHLAHTQHRQHLYSRQIPVDINKYKEKTIITYTQETNK